MAKTYGHERGKDGKVKIVDQTPSRGAAKSSGGRHGDAQKDGLAGRIVDGVLRKMGK